MPIAKEGKDTGQKVAVTHTGIGTVLKSVSKTLPHLAFY